MTSGRPLHLAANGYADLYALLEAEPAPPLDFIKCPLSPDGRAEVERARRFRPVLLHGWGPPGFSATQRDVPEPDLLRDLARLSGSPWLSVHLDLVPSRDGDLTPDETLDRVAATVERLRDLAGLPILLENIPFFPFAPRETPRWCTDPAFIAAALDASGTDLLLDLAHASLSADYRGEDVRAHVAALPLHRVREIHISGPRRTPQGLRDRHLTLRDEDWALLRWTLDRAPNVTHLTHEYMGRRANTAEHDEPHGPEALHGELHKLHALRAELA